MIKNWKLQNIKKEFLARRKCILINRRLTNKMTIIEQKLNDNHMTKIRLVIHKATNHARLLKNQQSIKQTCQLIQR